MLFDITKKLETFSSKLCRDNFSSILSSCSFLFRIAVAATALQLIACSGGGGSSSGKTVAEVTGSGDVDNIYPLDIGDSWCYLVKGSTDNGVNGPQPYEYIVTDQVTGMSQVSGDSASVLHESFSDTRLPTDYYLEKTLGGVNMLGNSDSSDYITPALAPYAELTFPVDPGTGFKELSNIQISVPNTNAVLVVNSSVQYKSIEDIDVSGVTYSQVRNVSSNLVIKGAGLTSTDDIVSYYVPSIGLVKETDTNTTDYGTGSPSTDTSVQELIGYDVGGVKKGVQPVIQFEVPGVDSASFPDVGYDGNRLLVVFYGPSISGFFLSKDGTMSDTLYYRRFICLPQWGQCPITCI